jgi:hypothetical protein
MSVLLINFAGTRSCWSLCLLLAIVREPERTRVWHERLGRVSGYFTSESVAGSNLFFSSITVAEPTPEESSGESSLAASSVIMPPGAPTVGMTSARTGGSASLISDDDALSVASSLSLIDVPSEVGSPRVADGEFVLLYETASSVGEE